MTTMTEHRAMRSTTLSAVARSAARLVAFRRYSIDGSVPVEVRSGLKDLARQERATVLSRMTDALGIDPEDLNTLAEYYDDHFDGDPEADYANVARALAEVLSAFEVRV